LLQEVKGLVQLFFPAAGHGDPRAFVGKGQRNGLPDSSSPTGNHGTFSGQACHVLSPSYV
jgi:hypothetical protein